MLQRLKKKKGFSLTEMALVLGIVGVILGAVWVAAKSVFDANKADQASQDIMTIASNIRSTYMAANSFTGAITMQQWISAGVVPSNLVISTTAASNAWNGAVTITAGPGGNNRLFRIAYKGTPADACFRIASQLMNLGTNDAPNNFYTNSSATPVNNGSCPNGTVGLCSAAINTACQANYNSNNPSTEFDFTIH